MARSVETLHISWLLAAVVLPGLGGSVHAEGISVPADPWYVFEPIGDDAGLATHIVVAMHQDKDGFIWIGSHTGLFRFDGAQLVPIEQAPGRSWTQVSQLISGADGTLWISADGGIARFDGLRFVLLALPFAEDPAVRSLDVPQQLAFDRANNLYIASTRGLARLTGADPAQLKLWSTAEGLPEANVVAVTVAPDQTLWFAAGGKVGTLDTASGAIELFELFREIPDERIIAILADEAGTIWVRTQTHLLRRFPGAKEFVVDDQGIAEALGVGKPSLDRWGNILVPSRAGVFIKGKDGWTSLSARNGLRSSAVASVLEDREGQLWLGLDGAGVSKWAGRGSWAAWTTQNGLPDDGVWSSTLDSRGRLWVATNNGLGIWQPSSGRWRILRREDGLAGHGVWKTLEGPDRWTWSISRRVGLNRFDPQTLVPQPVVLPATCKSGPTDMVLSPGSSRLWVAGNDYLYTVAMGEKGQPRFEEVQLPRELTGCTEVVTVAPDGAVWTAGRNGIGRLDERGWRRFSKQDGLIEDFVDYLHADSGDTVWVDYRSPVGISRLHWDGASAKVVHFTRQEGLLSDTVWMVDRDLQGRLWIGHSEGLTVLSSEGRPRYFTRNDGLIWNDINQAGFLSLPDGSAFIGTSRGLAYYRPLENAVRPEPPDVVITSAKLGGIEMLDRKLPLVASKDSSFEVRYSGLTFKDPAKVRFRYRLAGLEEEYVETGLRQLRYPMLPAGTYTFEVHCLAADGLRSRVGASYTFTVETPWWLRWWSQLGLALAVIAVLLSILKARTYKLAADRRRLEIAVQERSAQLADANERLAKANNELRELSFTDALTGAKNRLFFSTVVESDVSAALRRHDPRSHPLERNSDLVFYLVDLDHFKTVNDSWGHASGDRVLQEAVRRLERSIRQSDLLVRWGGEEFLIMCRDTEQSEASVVARRILELIGGAPFVLDGVSLSRTCSVGWAVLPTPTAPTPRPISHHLAIVLADRALYLAKSSGRNQAVGVELREDILGRVKEDELLERPLQELDGVLFRLVRVPGPSGPPSPEPTQAAAP